jgi:hypothetical protein
MAHPQVTVTLKGGKAEFRSHGPESDEFAEYLSKMFTQCNNPSATQATVLAKARLGNTVLKVRELQAQKMDLLLKAADAAEEKSRDWSLRAELRAIHGEKARAAREEAHKIAVELGQ